ncbi:MAG: sugar phosphate isomerase/epimerase [Candidatus Hydrogenedentes bacterium]|nr:sugar phosphate isomerase/epimerase [Candidatus Hydrogenedentota bacterium]
MAFPQCMGGEGPIIETASQIVQDPFFEAIEITRVKDAALRRQLRSILQESRMEAYFGAQPITLGGGLDLNHPDAASRRQAVTAVKEGIDQAAELGCKAVAVLSGKVTADKEAAMQRLVDSLLQLCDYAHQQDLKLVLETFDQVPYGKNCLIGPTSDAVRVSEQVRRKYPDFGLMLDLSHLPLIGESAADAIGAAGDHLAHVHIGNCAMDDPKHPAYGDNHPRFGAPGTRNDVPELTEFLRVLLNTGYLSTKERNVVSFEVKPMTGESAEAVIAGSKRTLLEAWRNA